MKQSRRIITGGLALASMAILGWTWVSAQTKSAPADPLGLVPAASVFVISSDGDIKHQAGWEKTASFEAFRKSGLLDSLSKTVRELIEQIPDGRAQSLVEIYEFVCDRGLTVSIGFTEGEGPAIPYLTAVAHEAGSHGDALVQFVEGLGPEATITKQKVSKREVSRVVLASVPGVELAWWAEGKHLVLVAGLGAVDAAMSVADGTEPSFAKTNHGKKLAEKLDFERTNLCVVDLSILRDRFGAIPLPTSNDKTVADAMESAGLDTLNRIVFQSGYKGRALWSNVDVDSPSPRKGLMGLASDKTMTLKDLPPLPVGNSGFAAQSVSLVDIYDKLLEMAREVVKFGPPDASDQLDNLLEQMPEFLGCDLRNDLLAHLGTVHCIYSDSNQALLGAEYGLVIQVSNAAKLRTTVSKLLDRVGHELDAEQVTAIQRKKHGQNLITLKIGGGVFNPTFLIDDKWLCVASSSQTVSSFALRLKGELPTWTPDAETAEVLSAVPKNFCSIAVSYPRPTYRGLITATPFLMGLGKAGLAQASRFGQLPPIDLTVTPMDFPPTEVVVKPLFPNVMWSTVDESGIHYTTRNSAPTVPLVGGSDGSSVVVPAVLIALLLPAVQQAREAARRTQSKNNLKQLALALHNFHDVNGHFPYGTIPNKKLKVEERQSWLIPLLPYLDQAPLYNTMNINLKESAIWDSDELQPAIRTQMIFVQNPSQVPGYKPGEPATTDYAGWAGVGKDAPTEKCKPEKKGIFGYDRATKIQEITDGTSNTIMTSDVVAKGRGPWAQGGTATIRALTTKPYVNGPDGIGSPHVGGFHSGLADGSVRFISNNIDEKTLEALATRAGGEIINDY